MTVRELFFKDLIAALRSISSETTRDLVGTAGIELRSSARSYETFRVALRKSGVGPDDVESVVRDLTFGGMMAVLAVLDGATELSTRTHLRFISDDGTQLEPSLYDDFPIVLMDAGLLEPD